MDVHSPWHPRAVEGVTIVRTEEEARRVVAQLSSLTDAWHAVDTETHGLDIKKQGPVGNGEVICLSIFCGEEHDFGNGPCVWVDNWTAPTEAEPSGTKTNLLQLFKDYLADPRLKKCLHNLSFDRHVLNNEGLELKGFGADTMHMARLWDSSLGKGTAAAVGAGAGAPAVGADGQDGGEDGEDSVMPTGYSLAALTAALLPSMVKRPMKEIFSKPKLKADGTPGKALILPEPLQLQLSDDTRADFIIYSAHDARATHALREELERRLRGMPWGKGRSMYEYYTEYVCPFGELLTDMEAAGFKIDLSRLPAVETQAEADLAEAQGRFKRWASRQCPHARFMNPGSSNQLGQLLFAPTASPEQLAAYPALPLAQIKALAKGVGAPPEAVRTALGPDLAARVLGEEANAAAGGHGQGEDGGGADPDGGTPRAPGRPRGARGPAAKALPPVRTFKVEICDELRVQLEAEAAEMQSALARATAQVLGADAMPSAATLEGDLAKALKAIGRRRHAEIALTGLGIPAKQVTKSGAPSTAAGALQELVKSGHLATSLARTRGQDEAREAEAALGGLVEVGALETMLASFIRPLQALADRSGRIHSSLNLNTETGRLSSQRPNLQNQPALDKDRYRIRDVFTCEDGNALIVADYGQLELRLLAHMTGCVSMQEAFRLGGDFHSRTAMGMYPEIKQAVQRGEVLIEQELGPDGMPDPALKDVPLVKDKHGAERKKAKVLNFSIAYGKTAMGLSKDWGVSVEEAKATLERWYADRPEVRHWQEETIEMAKRVHYVRTLTGRYRRLPGIAARSAAERSHNQRAAINTPVQGTAADVVMMAMLKVHRHERLRALGWYMVLQVHDELILEGPEESKEEALAIVIDCMEKPFKQPLSVDLTVDAKSAKTWYDAK